MILMAQKPQNIVAKVISEPEAAWKTMLVSHLCLKYLALKIWNSAKIIQAKKKTYPCTK